MVDLLYVLAAKDLIRGLLKTDPAERLTIEQFMSHKWIAVSLFSLFCVDHQL